MRTRFVPLLAAALAACLASGCAGDGWTGGQAPASEGADAPEATAPEAPAAGPLANIAACDMLTQEEKRSMKLESEKPEKLGAARTCSWRYTGATIDDSYSVSVAIFDDKGVDDLKPLIDPKPITIGRRKGQIGEGPLRSGSCFVTISLTDSSLVESQTTGAQRKWKTKCEWSTRIMKLIEARLL